MDRTPPSSNPSVPPSQPPRTSASPDVIGGVSLQDGRRYTSARPSFTPNTPIGNRQPSVLSHVRPRLNVHAQIDRYSKAYISHHNNAAATETELELANSITSIRDLLDNPTNAGMSSGFIILWVPNDGGSTIRVIPPDETMQTQQQLATDLRQQLGARLTTLESKYTPDTIQTMKNQMEEEGILRNHAAFQLQQLGAPLPQFPEQPRMTVIGTGNITLPAAVAPPEHVPARQPLPANPQAPRASAETRRGEFRFGQEASSATEPRRMPDSYQPSVGQHRGAPPSYAEAELLPTFNADRRGNDRTNAPVVSTSSSVSSSPQRPEPSVRPETASAATSPAGRVAINKLGNGVNGNYTDLFRPTNDPSSLGALASVNAGDDQLYVNGQGINGAFKQAMDARGDRTQYDHYQHNLLRKCNSNSFYMTTTEDMGFALGLEASFVYRPAEDRNRTGAVMIHVFKGPYPNGNPDNRAMIYVVPPNGKLGMTKEEFEDEVTQTAADIVSTLHAYNTQASTMDNLPAIPVVRVCGFSSERYRHPDVAEEEVGLCIMRGLTAAIEHIRSKDGKPLTITGIELANGGSGNVFSRVVIPQAPQGVDDGFTYQPASLPANRPSLMRVPSILDTPVDDRTPSLPASPSPLIDDLGGDVSRNPNSFGRPFPPETPLMPRDVFDFHDVEINGSESGSSKFSFTREERVLLSPRPDKSVNVLAELQTASPQLANEFDDNKNTFARYALEATHGALPESGTPIKAATDSRAHSARKAMLARALVNLHRKHAAKESPSSRESAGIPDRVMPFIEIGVLCTKPNREQVLAGSGNRKYTKETYQRLIKKRPISPGLAETIARATNCTFKSKDHVLSQLIQDVERIENMRFQSKFDVSQLFSYQQFDDDAKVELMGLCVEYRDLLVEQKELYCGNAPSLTIIEGDKDLDGGNYKHDKVYDYKAREQRENNPDLYAETMKHWHGHHRLSALYHFKTES